MRILVVDDEFVALAKLMVILEPYGECQAATNGAQALEFFRKAIHSGRPYGLVTLDIQMPDLNGLDALGSMTQREKAAGSAPARKIVISAAPRRANVARAAQYGCEGFLVKPVSRDALITMLSKLGITPGQTQAEPGRALPPQIAAAMLPTAGTAATQSPMGMA